LTQFPSLDGFGPTRRTLQLYARSLSALARACAPAHPNWWHISMKVAPHGLVTDNIPLPGGGILAGRLDFHRARVVLEDSDGRAWSIPMNAGLTGSQMGDRVIAIAAEAGFNGEVERNRFENDEPGVYDAGAVANFFTALIRADRAFKRHGARLGDDAGPVRLWPHGFDLAMEWFGTRVESYNEGGKQVELPAQLNLGFYPGEDNDASYFYSNPWPFDGDKLLSRPLPAGASWHTEGWQGAMLPYTAVRDEDQLVEFGVAVFEIASPLLSR
jgi:hypothetical protein